MAVWVDEAYDPGQAVPGPGLNAWLEGLAPALGELSGELVAGWTTAALRQYNRSRVLLLEFVWETARASGGPDPGARLEFPDEASVAAVRIPLRISARAAAHEVNFAYAVLERLPGLRAAMRAGDLDEARARVFATGTVELPEELARAVVAHLLARCSTMAIPALKSAIVRAALELDPDYGRRVYEAAVRTCDVVGRGNPEGTAQITLSNLPLDWAAGALGRVDAIARAAKADGDPRGICLLRALIAVCCMDGTFTGLTDAAIMDYLKATRPDPDDPEDPVPGPMPGPRPGPGSGAPRPGPGPGQPPAPGTPPEDTAPEDTAREDFAREDSASDDSAAEDSTAEDSTAEESTAEESAEEDRSPAGSGAAGGSAGPFSPGIGLDVKVELAALLGLNAHPGELSGWGPLSPTHATALVRTRAAARWRWAVTDDSGYLLHAGRVTARPTGYPRRDARDAALVELRVPATLVTRLLAPHPGGAPVDPQLLTAWTPVLADIAAALDAAANAPPPDPARRFPDTDLRRLVQTSMPSCVGPCCAVPARRTEIDHLHPHARGGPTVRVNLAPMCKTEHRAKTKGYLRVARTGAWTFTWTTRLGTTIEVTTPPLIENFPDPPPPGAHPLPEPPRPNPDYDWRTHPIWDHRPTRPRRSRDWVAVKAAAIRTARTANHRRPPPAVEYGPIPF